MRPPRTSSMMSEIFPTCSPSDDITLFPSSVAAAMMSGPGPSPMPPPTMSAPPRVPPCGLIEPMIHLLEKNCLFKCASSVPELSAIQDAEFASDASHLTTRCLPSWSDSDFQERAHRY